MPLFKNRNGNKNKDGNGRRDRDLQHGGADQLCGDSWRIFRIMAEFVEGFEVMANVGTAVSVFGSARTRPAWRCRRRWSNSTTSRSAG